MLNIYLTLGYTEVAVGAFFLVDLYAEDGDLVEQAVQTAQRADETAEHAVNKYGADHDAYHQHKFPGEQGTQHSQEAFVELVG